MILRLGIGLILAAHGAQKLFGWWGGPGMTKWAQSVQRLRIRPALPWAWVAALSEFGGGLLVALGLLSPLGNLAIVGAMLVAIATVHLSKGFWVSKGGFEFNLTLIVGAVALAITGPIYVFARCRVAHQPARAANPDCGHNRGPVGSQRHASVAQPEAGPADTDRLKPQRLTFTRPSPSSSDT